MLNGQKTPGFFGLMLLASTVVGGPVLAQQPFNCPRVGGDLVVGLEAKLATLDQHTATSSATRNVAMNIFETLVTRDENMAATPELAKTIDVSSDGKVYTFTLRDGIKFHNGKPLTSADVAASFDRYAKIGVNKVALDLVEKWETPSPNTFIITLKEAQPTFLEILSSYSSPIVIVPAEVASKPPGQLEPIGTGPFQFVEFVPDSHVTLKRFEGYKPDDRASGMVGFGGYKKACVDTVRFKMLTESGARMAALETGEVHIAENVPTVSQKRLAADKNIKLLRLDNFMINVGYPNWSAPPTDNLKVRQAMLAALNMEEIMEAASDGAFQLNPSLQFPGSPYYSTAGKEFYNQHDREKAKRLLQEAGYDGKPVVLLTNREFPLMYNTALVMAEQLKAVGINAELLVLDWPTALAKSEKETTGWNFFFTFWATVTAQGGTASLRNLGDPNNVYKPKGNVGDPDFNKAFAGVKSGVTLEARQAAFAEAQKIAFERVLAIPFGIMPNVQGVRSTVENFKPFYNTRVSNVWLSR